MTSPLSFHCMICFEEFDTETLYPVVLPCGHTYICVECAGKINKCMECRATLFAPTTNTPNDDYDHQQHQRALEFDRQNRSRTHSSSSAVSAMRSGRRPVFHQTVHPMAAANKKRATKPKTRLPLPKNVVLLSLIEASQLANVTSNRMLLNHSSVSSTGSNEDSEEYKILMSTELATSSCGTYAVRSKKGLKIVPTMNGRSLRSTRQIFGDDKVLGKSLIKKTRNRSSWNHGEMHLSYGDRVQVVTVVDHWAKLARGYGYVYFANSSDLVKVGGVIDKACNIESMLYVLSFRRNHMLNQKSKLEKDAIKLMHELQSTMIANDDLTVIGAEAFKSEDTKPEECRDDKLLCNSSSKDMMNELRDVPTMTQPKITARSTTYRDPTSDFMGWVRSFYSSDEPAAAVRQEHEGDFAASAESWRRRNGREAASGINFRTGLSGHLGSQGHHANVHAREELLGASKLSNHGGLTPNRRMGRKRWDSFDEKTRLAKTKSME